MESRGGRRHFGWERGVKVWGQLAKGCGYLIFFLVETERTEEEHYQSPFVEVVSEDHWAS